MARREKRRAGAWKTIAYLWPDGSTSFHFQVARMGDRACARVVEAYSGDVLWRQQCPWPAWARCPEARRREGAMSILSKIAERKAAGPVRPSGVVRAGESRWPALHDLVTVAELPDGSKRELSRVSVFLDSGAVKASVTEPGLRASCFASGDSLESALDALEARVQADDPDTWRPWPDGQRPWEKRRK